MGLCGPQDERGVRSPEEMLDGQKWDAVRMFVDDLFEVIFYCNFPDRGSGSATSAYKVEVQVFRPLSGLM